MSPDWRRHLLTRLHRTPSRVRQRSRQ